MLTLLRMAEEEQKEAVATPAPAPEQATPSAPSTEQPAAPPAAADAAAAPEATPAPAAAESPAESNDAPAEVPSVTEAAAPAKEEKAAEPAKEEKEEEAEEEEEKAAEPAAAASADEGEDDHAAKFSLNADAPAFTPGFTKGGKGAKGGGGGGSAQSRQHPLQAAKGASPAAAAGSSAAPASGTPQSSYLPNSMYSPPSAIVPPAPGTHQTSTANPVLLQKYIAMQRQQMALQQLAEQQKKYGGRPQQQQQQQQQPRTGADMGPGPGPSGGNGGGPGVLSYYHQQAAAAQQQRALAQQQQQQLQHLAMQHQRLREATPPHGSLQQPPQQQQQSFGQQQGFPQPPAPVSLSSAPQRVPSPPESALPSSSGGATIRIADGRSVNFNNLEALVSSSVSGDSAPPAPPAYVEEEPKMMQALRQKTERDLSHITFSQRAPSHGEPGVMQFICQSTTGGATHLGALRPGELAAFHHDLSAVLAALKHPDEMDIMFGTWNKLATPFVYISCADHKAEVAHLDPSATPNTKPVTTQVSPAVFGKKATDDTLRYITKLIVEQDRFKAFRNVSFVEAVANGADLRALYSYLTSLQKDIEGFEVCITGLTRGICEVAVKTTERSIPSKGVCFENGVITDWKSLPTGPYHKAKEADAHWQNVLGLRRKKA